MTTDTTKPIEDKEVVEIKLKEEDQQIEEKGKGKRPVTKEKLRSIMEAASALTALGDEDEENEESQDGKDDDPSDPSSKRYIPEHKKPDAALTFPEKLMTMMKLADKEDKKEYCIAWLDDGKSFVIRNPDEFVKKVLPDYFKATKFSSFTRKLYRWGFRQVNRGIGPDDPIIFGNEYFQRDQPDLMVKMRSITAAGTRKAQSMEAAQHEIETHRGKRPMDMGMHIMEEQRKRMFLEQMLAQQQKFGMQQPDQSNFMQPASFQQSFNLASALRPMGGMQQQMNQQGFKNMNPQSFNPNPLNLYMAQQAQQNGGQMANSQQHQPPVPQMPQTGQSSYNQASTAEIVNAAINALRYAS